MLEHGQHRSECPNHLVSDEYPWGERTADSVVLCNASRKLSEGLLPLNHRRLYPPLVLCKPYE